MTIEMKEVKSSQIHSLGYDDVANRLHVRFHGKEGPGLLYTYPCTPDTHAEALAAESMGKYFGQFKSATDDDGNLLHPHTKVDEPIPDKSGS